MTMKFYMSFAKELKLKVRNVDGQFLRLWKLQEKNCLGGGDIFAPRPILNSSPWAEWPK